MLLRGLVSGVALRSRAGEDEQSLRGAGAAALPSARRGNGLRPESSRHLASHGAGEDRTVRAGEAGCAASAGRGAGTDDLRLFRAPPRAAAHRRADASSPPRWSIADQGGSPRRALAESGGPEGDRPTWDRPGTSSLCCPRQDLSRPAPGTRTIACSRLRQTSWGRRALRTATKQPGRRVDRMHSTRRRWMTTKLKACGR